MKKNLTYGIRADIPADAAESRIIPFILSTFGRDRHRTVLNQDNWLLENFRKNPVVAYQHTLSAGFCNNTDPDYVIGKDINVTLEGSGSARMLMGNTQFEPADMNPLAEKIFRKLLFGSLSRTSVGFWEVGQGKFGQGDEREGGINETFYMEGQELAEYSIVNIPSNPDAGKREIAMRQLREESYTALMYAFKELGGKFRLSQIENFRVKDILDLLDGKDLGLRENDPDKLRKLLADAEAKIDQQARLIEHLQVKTNSRIG